jgi:tripartite-type tricarboxylate transporter receptor subunit TctC
MTNNQRMEGSLSKSITKTIGLFGAAFVLMTGAAQAQNYPTHPVTIVVPFAAGGPTDVIARIVGESMGKTLGQTFVIENVTGAGGTTGITKASQATPDGYTIMMGHMGTHGAAPAVYKNLKYKPTQDFEPIGLAAGTPIVVVARKDFPAKNLQEFIAYLKANGDKLNEGHAGVGSVSFTSCVMFNVLAGAKPTRVPYTGTGPVVNDLLAGKIDYACDQIVSVSQQVQGGGIKGYAIATEARAAALPDVPTTTEGGLAEFKVSAWNALFAPKGTPKEVVAKLNEALQKAFSDPAASKRIADLGGVIPTANQRSSAYLGEFVASEVDRWGKVFARGGVAAQ